MKLSKLIEDNLHIILLVIIIFALCNGSSNIEGWGALQSPTYDINVGMDVSVSVDPFTPDSGKTLACVVGCGIFGPVDFEGQKYLSGGGTPRDHSPLGDQAFASQLFTALGLTKEEDGTISGTIPAALSWNAPGLNGEIWVGIDGSFKFTVITKDTGGGTTHESVKYLKVKITPGNDATTGLVSSDEGDGSTCNDGSSVASGGGPSPCSGDSVEHADPDTGAPVTITSAPEACVALNRARAEAGESVQAIKDSMARARNPFSSLFGDEETVSNINNMLNTTLTSEQISEHVAHCEARIGGADINEIVVRDMSDCRADFIEAVGRNNFVEIFKSQPEIFNHTISNVTQEITDVNKFSCFLDSIQQAHSQELGNIDFTALLQATQHQTGGGTQSTHQTNCNAVNVDQSACEYINDRQCCMNEMNTQKKNILDIDDCFGTVENIKQMINVTSSGNCNQDDSTFLDVDQESTTTFDFTAIWEQVSESAMTQMLWAAAIIAVVVAVIYVLWLWQKKSAAEGEDTG